MRHFCLDTCLVIVSFSNLSPDRDRLSNLKQQEWKGIFRQAGACGEDSKDTPKSASWGGYSVAFIWVATLDSFIQKNENHLVQRNNQHHRKVLLSGFHFNDHTWGFHPETQKLESHLFNWSKV